MVEQVTDNLWIKIQLPEKEERKSTKKEYIIQHRRKTYGRATLDKRGDLVDRVTDLEDTINDPNLNVSEDRIKEIADEAAIEAINNAEVNVDISA